MSNLTLLIPLRLPPQHGFFDPEGLQPQKVLGFTALLKSEPPYCYLELQEVPAEQADDVLERVRRSLKWAAVRLDMGMVTDREPLKHTVDAIFDGQFATAYPSGSQAQPIRVETRHRSEEPSNRLFAALDEGAGKIEIGGSTAKKSTLLACEFFAAADFETTANSQFLMLSTVFEVPADPKQRPTLCVYLVQGLLERVKKAEAIAKRDGDDEMGEALEGLRNSVVHYEKDSITSSIRKLATETSRTLGDPDLEKTGKRAAALYGKRSNLVHSGESVTWGDVNELRKLVREALAVDVGCYERIRDRFP